MTLVPKALLGSLAVILIALSAYLASIHVGVSLGDTVFGATAGPDRFTPDGCETVNGYRDCFFTLRMAASSSLASFKSPGATSTVQVACSQSSDPLAEVIQIGWGATQYATTTLLAQNTFAANIPGVVIATSTNLTAAIQAGTDGAIPPNTWVNARFSTSAAATINAASSPQGNCSAKFHQI